VRFLTNQAVGDYVVKDLVSQGDGQLYIVEHTITRRREAMKVVAGNDRCSVTQADRFFREIRVQASLTHPNIARVHNAFWANDDLVLICELVDGEQLTNLLERGPIPPAQAVDIACQILSALSHAHAHGVIHRNFSAACVFLRKDGTVKLVDFGVLNTNHGIPVRPLTGSDAYRSPGQARAAEVIDGRSDLHAFGVVLHEMLTGHKPFMRLNRNGELDLRLLRDWGVPKQLNSLLQRALTESPDRRFESADALWESLLRIRNDLARRCRNGIIPFQRQVFTAAAVSLSVMLVVVASSGRPQQKVEMAASARVVDTVPEPPRPPLTASTKLAPPRAVQQTGVHLMSRGSTTTIKPVSEQSTKRKNPVIKFAGAFKRLNPFRRNSKASTQEEARSSERVEQGSSVGDQ
jgi:eukaryotic-like serine/threonine-protein kinase